MKSEVGRGSTFYFTARFERARSEAPARTPRAPALNLVNLSVLVVDDNATNRRILTEILTNWRMRPSATSGGEDALRMMKAAAASGRPFQLLLSDGQMPSMPVPLMCVSSFRQVRLAPDTTLRSRGAGAPEVMNSDDTLWKAEGAGESRVPMTPAVVRKNAHGGPQVRRNTRPSLRGGLSAYAAISPS